MDGTVTALSDGSLTVIVSGGNAASLPTDSTTYSNSEIENFAVMMYEKRVGSNFYKMGLYLTSYGDNNSPYLDVFSGTDANTVVRVGNINGLTYRGTTINEANGWGFYAKGNAYFEGKVVSSSGQIGGWEIGTSKLYNNTDSMSSTAGGLYLGTDGIRNYNATTQNYVNITNGVITAMGANITGEINADSGTIGGFTISSETVDSVEHQFMYYGATSPAANGFLLYPSGTTGSLSLYQTNHSIGFTIINNLAMSVSNKFGVTTDGKIYAQDATINTGKIGSWNLTHTALSTGTYGSNNSIFLSTEDMS